MDLRRTLLFLTLILSSALLFGQAPADDHYRIGPGDVLKIDVFQLDELDATVRVSTNGAVTLPLLGPLQLESLTVPEAELLIAQNLADRELVNQPQVAIFVEEYSSNSVSVQGAVERPGVYPLTRRTTLLEILGQAGGVKAERGGQIVVLRSREDTETSHLEIDLDQLLLDGNPEANIPLVAGDIVLVPQERKQKVYVSGAVTRPGAVDFSATQGITVLQAVTAAGGAGPRANLKNVTIVRRGAQGEQTRIEVNLKAVQKGKEDDQTLEANDTVIVGEWFL